MGSVVVSLDAELAWGFTDQAAPPTDRIEAGRDAWTWLLERFDAHSVPATWAVVGHLFLARCDRDHAGLQGPPDWFAHERGRLAGRPELRYAPDLVDAIVDADVDHDVGSHSFSHVLYDDDRLSRAGAAADLDAAVDAAGARGVDPSSFVFPRNAVGHRDLLADRGFRIYRQPPVDRPGSLSGAVGKLAAALDPGRVPLVHPAVDEHGLVSLPTSLFLFGFEGRARSVLSTLWTDPIVRQATRAIDRAAVEDGICHLWLHPNNVVTAADRARVDAVLSHVARRRDDGDLRVETMADVADRLLGTEPESDRVSQYQFTD